MIILPEDKQHEKWARSVNLMNDDAQQLIYRSSANFFFAWCSWGQEIRHRSPRLRASKLQNKSTNTATLINQIVWKKIWEKRNFSRLDREAWRLNWNSGEVDEVLTRFFLLAFCLPIARFFFFLSDFRWLEQTTRALCELGVPSFFLLVLSPPTAVI